MASLRPVPLATGVTLDVWEAGDVRNEDASPADNAVPVLIFLHGFPENHRGWRHQIAALSDRYRCIAPDQRSYGGSSKPADTADYAPAALIADIFALADALDIERFTLIGHDWGGALAWGAAFRDSAAALPRIERLVIANGPHPAIFQRLIHTDPVQRAASQYIRHFRDTTQDALIARAGLAPILAQSFASADLLGGMEPEDKALLQTQWADPATARAMLNWYRASPVVVPAMDAPFALPDTWREGRFPLLTLPTLVIWGEDDIALPPANLDGLDAAVQNLCVVRLPQCGHFSPWQAPDAVTAAITAFLDAG